jgi:hypothetical protein
MVVQAATAALQSIDQPAPITAKHLNREILPSVPLVPLFLAKERLT